MNNSKTPKIVVGVGLVAVYAAALTSLALRGEHDIAVAQSPTSTASAPMVDAAAPPPVSIPESAETSAPVTTPAPIAPEVTNAVKAEPRAKEAPVASLPSSRPPTRNNAAESSRSNSGSNAVGELPPTADTVAGESVTSADDRSSDQDIQSTTEPATSTTDN